MNDDVAYCQVCHRKHGVMVPCATRDTLDVGKLPDSMPRGYLQESQLDSVPNVAWDEDGGIDG